MVPVEIKKLFLSLLLQLWRKKTQHRRSHHTTVPLCWLLCFGQVPWFASWNFPPHTKPPASRAQEKTSGLLELSEPSDINSLRIQRPGFPILGLTVVLKKILRIFLLVFSDCPEVDSTQLESIWTELISWCSCSNLHLGLVHPSAENRQKRWWKLCCLVYYRGKPQWRRWVEVSSPSDPSTTYLGCVNAPQFLRGCGPLETDSGREGGLGPPSPQVNYLEQNMSTTPFFLARWLVYKAVGLGQGWQCGISKQKPWGLRICSKAPKTNWQTGAKK